MIEIPHPDPVVVTRLFLIGALLIYLSVGVVLSWALIGRKR